MSPKDYTKLRQLLKDQEKFPHDFTHKFIGRNTPRFALGIEALEKRFPAAKLQSARTSQGDGHLAMTYIFTAQNADEIIELLEATAKIEDLIVIL